MIQDLNDGENINVIQFVNKYRQAPYGIGEVSMELFLAYVIKYFGDELCYKENPNEPGEICIQSFNQIEDLINSPKPFAVFEKRKLDEIQRELLIDLYKYFSKISIPVDFVPTLKNVVIEMNHWFDGLQQICRSEDFYSDNKEKGFIQFMKALSPNDPYHFLFERLQTIWGYEENDRMDKTIKTKIFENIKTVTKALENKRTEIEEEIFNRFTEIFGVEGKTYGNLEEAIKQWYNNLDANQRSISEKGHTPTSQPIIRHLKDTQSLRKVLYEDLPACSDYGMGKITDWNTNNVQTYISKIQDGLNVIRDLKVLVDLPIVHIENSKVETKTKTDVIIRYENKEEIKISVKIPENAYEVWISYNGEDPTAKNIQKVKIKKDEKVIPTQSNQLIKLVSIDKEGNFSQILTLYLKEEFIDKVRRTILGYEIDKPKGIKNAKLILKDLVFKFIHDESIDRRELSESLKLLAKDLENEN